MAFDMAAASVVASARSYENNTPTERMVEILAEIRRELRQEHELGRRLVEAQRPS